MSLAQTVSIPQESAASLKPPIPANISIAFIPAKFIRRSSRSPLISSVELFVQ
jgi:hypothetical protein